MAKTVEQREFRMDKRLLFDVITRQAGSLWKAILEGIMNSIDARSSRVDITLTERRLIIKDNGTGFTDRTQIENWFEVFGQPHDDSEIKTYGAFRMGRGQLFAFGRNVWRTGQFRMHVDIKKDGLSYVLEEGLNHADGCEITIDLYNVLSATVLVDTVNMLATNIAYVPIPIVINDVQHSRESRRPNWTLETPEADIRLSPTGGLQVYNLGIHVVTLGTRRLGVGGLIVTKKPLAVNFARNDILDTCPVWQRIKESIAAHRQNAPAVGVAPRRQAPRRTVRRKTRKDLIETFYKGTAPRRKVVKIFAVEGSNRFFSITDVFEYANGRITFAPPSAWHELQKRIIMDQRRACVLEYHSLILHHIPQCIKDSKETPLPRLALFPTQEQIETWLQVVYRAGHKKLEYIPFETLVTKKDNRRIIPKEEYLPMEGVLLTAAMHALRAFPEWLQNRHFKIPSGILLEEKIDERNCATRIASNEVIIARNRLSNKFFSGAHTIGLWLGLELYKAIYGPNMMDDSEFAYTLSYFVRRFMRIIPILFTQIKTKDDRILGAVDMNTSFEKRADVVLNALREFDANPKNNTDLEGIAHTAHAIR